MGFRLSTEPRQREDSPESTLLKVEFSLFSILFFSPSLQLSVSNDFIKNHTHKNKLVVLQLKYNWKVKGRLRERELNSEW